MHEIGVTKLSCGNGLRVPNHTQNLLKTSWTLMGVPIGNLHQNNGLAIQELMRVDLKVKYFSGFSKEKTKVVLESKYSPVQARR